MSYYEWDLETLDENQDIIDHWPADSLSDLPLLIDPGHALALVMTTSSGARYWAYATCEGLPRVLEDSSGKYSVPVPASYLAEFQDRLNSGLSIGGELQ